MYFFLFCLVQVRHRERTFRMFDETALANCLFDIRNKRSSDEVNIHAAVDFLLEKSSLFQIAGVDCFDPVGTELRNKVGHTADCAVSAGQ